MGALGLRETKAGLPIAALPDEMLAEGEDRVRALITVGGNPVAAIPDTRKTVTALKSLELSVQVDPWMSQSAKLADYVIAPTMPLEVAATTKALDFLSGWTGYGLGASYAQYTPAIVAPPPGSDLIDDWQFLHGLAIRLSAGNEVGGNNPGLSEIGKDRTTEQFIEMMTAKSRVPLASVKSHPGGALFPEPIVSVAPKDQGCSERLEVGNGEMMRDLERHAKNGPPAAPTDDVFPLRLVCRRHMHVYNSSCNIAATNRGKPYNPAFLNPVDMQATGLSTGDLVTIRSAHGHVSAVVEEDTDLPPGLVSIMFGYGADLDDAEDVRRVGTNPNQLTSCETLYEPYTGQPRMSNLPVEVVKGAGPTTF